MRCDRTETVELGIRSAELLPLAESIERLRPSRLRALEVELDCLRQITADADADDKNEGAELRERATLVQERHSDALSEWLVCVGVLVGHRLGASGSKEVSAAAVVAAMADASDAIDLRDELESVAGETFAR